MGQYDLTSLNKAKAYMHLTDADLEEDVITVFCSATDATAATVQVSVSDTYASSLSLKITSGSDAGSDVFDLSSDSYDTTLELAGAMNDADGWSARLVGSGSYPSSDLSVKSATNCLTGSDAITLRIEDNFLLSMLIEQASVLIEKELGYNILVQTYQEVYSGLGGSTMWLNQLPIVNIKSICIGRDNAMTVQYTGGNASQATVEVTNTNVILRKKVSGIETTNNLAFSDSVTLDAMETAIDAVSDWTASITSSFLNYPSADLIRMPGRDANGENLDLEVPEEPEDDYEILNADEASIYNPYRWNLGRANIVIDYVAGRASVPEPIESACLELIKMLHDLSKRDTSLRSEGIGDYRYTVADRLDAVFSASGDTKTANMISLKLGPYKRKTLFAI